MWTIFDLIDLMTKTDDRVIEKTRRYSKTTSSFQSLYLTMINTFLKKGPPKRVNVSPFRKFISFAAVESFFTDSSSNTEIYFQEMSFKMTAYVREWISSLTKRICICQCIIFNGDDEWRNFVLSSLVKENIILTIKISADKRLRVSATKYGW